MAPAGGGVLSPGACDCVTFHSKRDFADVTKTLAVGKVPWIAQVGPVYSLGSLEGEGKKGTSEKQMRGRKWRLECCGCEPGKQEPSRRFLEEAGKQILPSILQHGL